MSAPVLDLLPGELLEKILLLLDPASAMDFGMSSTRLQALLAHHATFSRVLDKVDFEVRNREEEEEQSRLRRNQELVKKIALFISTTASPIPLMRSLQDTISCQFPAKPGGIRLGGGETIVLERFHQETISVDTEGLLLLLAAREDLALSRVSLGMWSGKLVGGALLAALSCLAAQTPGRRLQLEVFFLECAREEEGLALAKLLESCAAWSVENLSLAGQVGKLAWQGLARAADRGKIFVVNVEREVIEASEVEDLRRVWGCTEVGWGVGREHVWRREGEESWRRIEMWRKAGEGAETRQMSAPEKEVKDIEEKGLELQEQSQELQDQSQELQDQRQEDLVDNQEQEEESQNSKQSRKRKAEGELEESKEVKKRKYQNQCEVANNEEKFDNDGSNVDELFYEDQSLDESCFNDSEDKKKEDNN